MSLVMPIYVNERTIGGVTITRGKDQAENQDTYRYDWEVNWTDLDGRPRQACGGGLSHRYAAGPLALIEKVLSRVNLAVNA